MRGLASWAAIGVAMMAVGCGGGEPEHPWEIDGPTVSCLAPDDTWTYESGDYQSYTCVWDCTWFEGEYVYLDVTFEGVGSSWVVDAVYVADCL